MGLSRLFLHFFVVSNICHLSEPVLTVQLRSSGCSPRKPDKTKWHDLCIYIDKMKHKGFSLIEVMISLFIFTLLVLGTFQTLIYSLAVQQRCQNRITSLELAANRMEKLKSLRFDHPKLNQSEQQEMIRPPGSNKTYRLMTSVQDISQNVKQIEISCSPQDRDQYQVSLVLYVCQELGF
ncbi:MAG: prepilin-type N-terminal cleavage/methylation domain-containing protein [Candidatus Aminicenantes bacterium]|nr:prepilin-type N-terminal cleavage/methylation domain-containing protein [Candidatus Aminicenantes bacterium]